MINIMYVGPPGVGKTAFVLAQYDHTEVLLSSALSEEDIAGLPYREGDIEYRTKPAWFVRLISAAERGAKTCLFLDELDKARREVADTLLTLVHGRTIGEHKIPQSTDIVAAANPPEWGGGDGISQAMQSRFSVVEFEPKVSDWCAWARARYSEPAAHAVIDSVESGATPLLDHAGEGYKMRITCPRTLAMALDAACSGRLDLVSGLITPAACAAFGVFSHRVGKGNHDIVRKAAVVTTRLPLRVTDETVQLKLHRAKL